MDTDRLHRVRSCAKPQKGVFNRTQGLAAGHTPDSLHRALARGEYEMVLPNVYRIGGTPRSWEQSAMGAHLWAGEPSALSFTSAAAARGYLPKIEPIHLSMTRRSRSPGPGIVVHWIDECLPGQIEYLGHMPLTNEPRTALDLAGIGHPKTDWVLDAGIRNGTPISAYASAARRPPHAREAWGSKARMEARTTRSHTRSHRQRHGRSGNAAIETSWTSPAPDTVAGDDLHRSHKARPRLAGTALQHGVG